MASRTSVFGISAGGRKQRKDILDRLFHLFEGSDAADEVRRLKEQDDGF